MEKYCRAGQATEDNIIWHMRIACWITKATNAHSEYVTLLASPLQQWLHEHASVFHYTYITRLVVVIVSLYMICVDLSGIFPPSKLVQCIHGAVVPMWWILLVPVSVMVGSADL
jgi:hypothetical protein